MNGKNCRHLPGCLAVFLFLFACHTTSAQKSASAVPLIIGSYQNMGLYALHGRYAYSGGEKRRKADHEIDSLREFGEQNSDGPVLHEHFCLHSSLVRDIGRGV